MSEIYDSESDTREHIFQVAARLKNVCTELRDRGYWHDMSKLGPEEKPLFDRLTPMLKGLTYGSDEYKACLKELGEALEHHYRENSHHPEHYGSAGISGMDLLDLIEMYCDWAAAVTRHDDGDLGKSIEHNSGRFKMGDVLTEIFRNTIIRHGGFCGYENYHLAGIYKPVEGVGWTLERDVGTGQEFWRMPKQNAKIDRRAE
jgi:hypothetical protein